MSKRRFFPILGTLQIGGDYALGDAYERPGFRPKSSPPPSWRIFGVFRGLASEGRRLGARLTIELWDARDAFVSVLVGSRRSRILELTLIVGFAGFFRPSISSQCRLESFWMGTCFRNIFLIIFEKKTWNRNFVGNRRLFWGASEFPKAPAKGFSRTTAANFNLLLRVKAPLCKDFSV